MGTRADFYVGRDAKSEWIGSIGWDGYEIPDEVRNAATAEVFRAAVRTMLEDREDGTLPERDGWPWPWETSQLTDYVYAFDGGVWYCSFDRPWHPIAEAEPEHDEPKGGHDWPLRGGKPQGAIFGPNSGVIVISGGS